MTGTRTNAGAAGSSTLLRSIREACGLTQDRWAAFVGVSRKTVQRWEAGEAVPDARTEEAILALCEERRVLGGRGDAAVGVTPSELSDALRRDRALRGRDGADTHSLRSDEPFVDFTNRTLFGRQEVMARLRAAVSVSRLVTLTGTGGVGKTSLAAAFAVGTPAVFVRLASLRDHELLGTAIAAALEVRQTRRSTLRDSIVMAIGDRQVLLLLDNFEHLAEAAPLVGDLVVSCPRLRVLVTSRRALHLSGEHILAVEPLPSAAAVDLFVARAGLPSTPDAELLHDIKEICARLDGLPLAIELAAARARLLPPAAMLARLDRALGLAIGGPATTAERHRALHSTLAWSYDLLDEVEQKVLQTLSLFAGGCERDAARAVIGALPNEVEAWKVIEHLREHSLVTVDENSAPVRVQMLETIRAFANEQRAEAGPEALGVGRFVEWYAAFAEAQASAMVGPDQRRAFAAMSVDGDNVRLALGRAIERGEAEAALRLTAALAPWWDLRGALSEARGSIDQVLALDGPDILRAIVQNWGAYLASLEVDYERATALAESALEVWNERGIAQGQAYALLVLGQAAVEQGQVDDGEGLLRQSAQLFATSGDRWGRVRPLNSLGEAARGRGEWAVALGFHDEALELSRAVGDAFGEANVLCGRAHALIGLRRLDEATANSTEALQLALDSENVLQTCAALEAAAGALVHAEHWDVAVRMCAAALERREKIGAPVEPRDRKGHEQALQSCRRALGADRFVSEWRAGAALTDVDLRDLVARLNLLMPNKKFC